MYEKLSERFIEIYGADSLESVLKAFGLAQREIVNSIDEDDMAVMDVKTGILYIANVSDGTGYLKGELMDMIIDGESPDA